MFKEKNERKERAVFLNAADVLLFYYLASELFEDVADELACVLIEMGGRGVWGEGFEDEEF